MKESLNEIFEKFKINATCVNARQHRHFSFYDVELDYGTRISKIMRCSREIALAMRVKKDFIIKAMPHEGIIRLQTSHADITPLHFSSFYDYEVNNSYPGGTLPILLGETDEGQPLWFDMEQCPHLLVAGSTGSGKSTALHTIIANFIYRNDTSVYLVDTKKIEFNIYKSKTFANKIKYCAENYIEAMAVLRQIYDEMERRYDYLSQYGLYNAKDAPWLPKIVVIIDEVSDLMMQQEDKEFENMLARLAQKARSAGIYIILATQRPSADVLTGLIKSNFPARLACKVASKTDSRVILDAHGAENLNGRGDAIIKTSQHDFVRLQVAYTNPEKLLSWN
jgi:S-DNA-T family DNA segregation ATPase FtsK/SpoIIIE